MRERKLSRMRPDKNPLHRLRTKRRLRSEIQTEDNGVEPAGVKTVQPMHGNSRRVKVYHSSAKGRRRVGPARKTNDSVRDYDGRNRKTG